MYLSNARYNAALTRIAKQIEEGSPLVLDNTPSCSWGLCSTGVEQWPDSKDAQYLGDGKVRPLALSGGQHCPLDGREKPQAAGCYYACRAFSNPEMDAAEALARYAQALGLPPAGELLEAARIDEVGEEVGEEAETPKQLTLLLDITDEVPEAAPSSLSYDEQAADATEDSATEDSATEDSATEDSATEDSATEDSATEDSATEDSATEIYASPHLAE